MVNTGQVIELVLFVVVLRYKSHCVLLTLYRLHCAVLETEFNESSHVKMLRSVLMMSVRELSRHSREKMNITVIVYIDVL